MPSQRVHAPHCSLVGGKRCSVLSSHLKENKYNSACQSPRLPQAYIFELYHMDSYLEIARRPFASASRTMGVMRPSGTATATLMSTLEYARIACSSQDEFTSGTLRIERAAALTMKSVTESFDSAGRSALSVLQCQSRRGVRARRTPVTHPPSIRPHLRRASNASSRTSDVSV